MKLVVSIAYCLAMVQVVMASDELDIARKALRDGLWSVARSHAETVITNDAAKLVVLESYAREDDWPAVAKALDGWKTIQGVKFAYYRAASSGDYATAAKLMRESAKDGDPADMEAKMMEASLLAKAGDRTSAEKLWSEVAASTNSSERAIAIASSNIGDVKMLRNAYEKTRTASLRRFVGLRLGQALLKFPGTIDEGSRLIRLIVKDAPDSDGAMLAFLALADVEISMEKWKDAERSYHEAIETWPDAVKLSRVHEGRGWAQLNLGKYEDALASFKRAEERAEDDEQRAVAVLKQGDILSELGRGEEAMKRYREALSKYPKTIIAEKAKRIVHIRELEDSGKDLYKEYHFAAAQKVFAEVAAEEPSRRPRMEYFEVLCLYGQGMDDVAEKRMREIIAKSPDENVRADAILWLAKFLYNRRQWKEAGQLFLSYSDVASESAFAPDALMWASRAAFAENDFARSIQIVSQLKDKYPDSAACVQAFLVQGESLIGLARFDEAVLVLERVAMGENTLAADRIRAQVLKSDSLFAMGADNPARYLTALEEYRSVRFGGLLTPSQQINVSFKIGRTLEKLKRMDEAMDQYYTQVVLAYCDGLERGERYDDDAGASFSKAALRLADEFESRGKDSQTVNILRLVLRSGVPAADEAKRRIDRIEKKGMFL